MSCPSFDYALPAYYLIAPSECSSNLARFDAMRFGLRVGDDGTRSAEEVMALTRAAGFGPEVKRRIMLGTYALSSGYYDAYYGSAQKVRTLITRDFDAAFDQCDVLVSPTTPTTAFPIGEKLDDPLAMYLDDLAPSRRTSRATRRCRCRAGSRPTTGCRSACRSWRRRSPTTGSTASAPRSRRRSKADGATRSWRRHRRCDHHL